VAPEASLCVEIFPLQVGSRQRHVGQSRNKNRFAAVILLISGLRSVIIANPASVALVRDPLYDAATCPYLISRRLPRHLLVINVAIVVERVVLGWAFVELELEDPVGEVPLAVENLAATQIRV